MKKLRKLFNSLKAKAGKSRRRLTQAEIQDIKSRVEQTYSEEE